MGERDVNDRAKLIERRRRWASEVQLFVERYGRKARAGGLDPNDRNYDHRVEDAIKRMKWTLCCATVKTNS